MRTFKKIFLDNKPNNYKQNNLYIEPIEKDSVDYIELLSIKKENNKKYSLKEVIDLLKATNSIIH